MADAILSKNMKSSAVYLVSSVRLCRSMGPLVAAVVIFSGPACKRTAPTPKVEQAPITVRGTEHFEWDQLPLAGGKIEEYEFVAYVDDDPRPLVDTACQGGADTGQFRCSARLPSMKPGRHRLQVVASIMGKGERIESRKSVPLDLLVAPPTDPK
jgi:hypothetical protein